MTPNTHYDSISPYGPERGTGGTMPLRAAAALLAICALVLVDFAEVRRAEAQARNADDLLIVDCLLPGQVRRLGQRATFISARRAIRTTAADCAIRGGEYTAYDRADYATALKVWLPLAQQGDPEAQVYVGEIYEKGLGVEPQYALAAEWYRKAAEQGDARAQINLGALYERGLGVPQDAQQAVYWYRRASGLEAAQLPYIPATVEAELAALKADRERLSRELEEVRSQLDDARRQLQRRSSEAEKARAAAEASRKALEAQRAQAQAAGDSAQAKALERELKAKQAEAERRAAEVADLRAQVERLNRQADGLKRALAAESAGRASEVRQLRAEAEAAKAELARVNERLLGAERELERRTAEVAQSRARFEEARAALERERAAASRDDKRLAALEQTLREREDELAARRKQVSELNAAMTALEQEAARLKRAAAEQAEARKQEMAAAPRIEILDPALQTTRSAGLPAVKVRSVGERVVVGRVDAPAGLVALIVNDREHKLEEGGVFRASVPLQFPETRVSVVAIDGRGQRAAMQFLMQPDAPAAGARRAADQEAEVPAIAPQTFGRFHALVIGNNDYRQLPKLETAVADAEAVADLLKRRYGFSVTLLLNADRYAILSALNKLRESLTDEDNLLIYYAGHGELDRVNQRGHWLPVDAEPDSTANWISNIQITDVLNAMSAKQVLVVADSCYSGTLTRASLAQLDSALSEKARAEWIKLMAGKRARLVLSSGGVQPVLDSGGGKHSVFAQAFLSILNDADGVLEGQRLYRIVAERVAASAAAASVEQLPQYAPIKYAGHEAGDFFFVPIN